MSNLRMLALDLGSTTGWCEGQLGTKPRYGSIVLAPKKGALPADKYNALEDWLWDRFEGPLPPQEVCYEAPLIPQAQGNSATARMLIGFSVIVESVCRRAGVRCTESHLTETRKAVIGRGNFKQGEAKPAVFNWCQSNGWDVPDDNSADAIILWLRTQQVRAPALAADNMRGPDITRAMLG